MWRRLKGLAVALALVVGVLAVPTAANAQNPAAVADTCKSLRWESSTEKPSYMFWVVSSQAHRAGHFWTSRNCGALFAYWSEGQAFEGLACTDVRIIVWNGRGRWVRTTVWRTTCGGTNIPLVFSVSPGTEISFECRNHRGPTPDRWCLYNPVRF